MPPVSSATISATTLSATDWTQLSDVEDELNGLVTYDREVAKIDPDVVRRATTLLREAMLGR